ncbi:Phage protein [Enterococcus devriesei]|uniref:Phage protein n=2 Tax=Enterococcus devriesei TaxID=319970 RepID=A0A1L8SAK3_9ENTE|nr:Phage protein [Enterococcus devriesei]
MYLFEQLERLNEPDMKEGQKQWELERSRAVANLASQVVAAGQLALRAEKAYDRNEAINAKMPEMLEADTADKIE